MNGVVLVGNGPSVLKARLGAAIDAFETVARCNQYRTRGFEEWTGSKTDVWCVNEGWLTGEQQPPEARPPRVLLAAAWWKPGAGGLWRRCADMCLDGVKLIDEEAARMAWRPGSDKWASTGLLALCHFALREPPVSIVGFDHFDHPSWHHYFGEGAFCWHHDPEHERALVVRLARSGRVRLM